LGEGIDTTTRQQSAAQGVGPHASSNG